VAELWETLSIGLVISLLFIGLSYFFWQRYDKPTPLMVEREEEQQRLKAERKTWRQVEAKMEADRLDAESKARYEQRKAQERARAEPPKQEQVANAWGALGVGAPTSKPSEFETEGVDANALQRASVQGGLGTEEANDDDVLSVDELVQVRQDPGVSGMTEEPDWELIEKITEIAEKDDLEVPEVPEAPDLPSVEELLSLSLEGQEEPVVTKSIEVTDLIETTNAEQEESVPVDGAVSNEEDMQESTDSDDPWTGTQWSNE
jgi:hypothetical protein